MTSTRFTGRSRWLALLAVVVLAAGATSTSVLASAPPTAGDFTYTPDDQGPNDEPGQKDLTAQATLIHDGSFYTAWKWDDTAWNGRNTGDGCSLFDAGTDGFVDYAVCATIGGKPPVFQSVSVYSCNNKWVDRCGNPVLLYTSTTSTACRISSATGTFDTTDTLAICNITTLASVANAPTLGGSNLINTCSYPSQQPNSDPSDCVLTPTAVPTSMTTLSSGTWSVTLKDTAQLTPSTATGSVVFKLWSDSACTTLVWTSPSITVDTSGAAATAGGGTPSNGNTITNATVNEAGIYYWTAAFTATGLFTGSTSTCGEATTINIPVVTGTSG